MIRVYINGDFIVGGIAIRIALEQEGDYGNPPERRIMHFGEHGYAASEPIDPTSALPVAPTLTLDDDTARALLEELTRHYHGADDTRALRRDYDNERGRVDKLTDALIGITTRP